MPTARADTASPSLAAHALGQRPGYVLMKLGDVIAAGADETLADLALTGRQYDLMASVDADNSLSQRDIGRLLGLDPNVIGDLIDDLEGRDLVTRARNETDRRRHTLTLTPSGRKLLGKADAATEAGEQKLLAPLSPSELRTLHNLAARVLSPHWPVRQDRP